jgi:hypothetical protein
LLVIQDTALAAKSANWQAHLKHSEAYQEKPN